MSSAARAWRPPRRIRSPWLRGGLALVAVAYLVAAVLSVEVDAARLREGLPRGITFLAAFFPPDLWSRGEDIAAGVLESIWMTLASTALGIVASVPVALGAARNLSPAPVYALCRAIVVVSRSFQEVILAVLFVALFGFGPFAGCVTLIVATVGFFGKLLAEEIEEIAPGPLEAARAAGAGGAQRLVWAVWPQVAPRFVGLSLYRLDINFRESAIVGIVGGGGIGATLSTALDRYEFDTAAAILLVIIGIVLAVEWASARVRARVQ